MKSGWTAGMGFASLFGHRYCWPTHDHLFALRAVWSLTEEACWSFALLPVPPTREAAFTYFSNSATGIARWVLTHVQINKRTAAMRLPPLVDDGWREERSEKREGLQLPELWVYGD